MIYLLYSLIYCIYLYQYLCVLTKGFIINKIKKMSVLQPHYLLGITTLNNNEELNYFFQSSPRAKCKIICSTILFLIWDYRNNI